MWKQGEICRNQDARRYSGVMAKRTKDFDNGGPLDEREPAEEWPAEFLETLGAWQEPIERPRSHLIAKKQDPFG